MYDAVIFDKDGVLLDSMEDGYLWADKLRLNVYRRKGVDVKLEESTKVARAQEPGDLNFLLDRGLTKEDILEAERRIREKKIEKIREGKMKLFPDVKPTLNSLSVPKAVVSNAPLKVTRFTVEYFELQTHFATVKSPSLDSLDDYIRMKKPCPEMIREVVDRIGAENPLMVGDTSEDVEVATNAGIDCALVNSFRDYPDLDPEYRFDSVEKIPSVLD